MSLILRQETASNIATPASGKGVVFLDTTNQVVIKDSLGATTTVYSSGGSNPLSTTGNVTGGNILTSGVVSATGNGTFGNVIATHYGSGAGLSSITGANVTGTVANATYATSAGSATTATTAGTVTTAAQPNITSTGTLTSLSVTGNINSGNIISTLHVGNLSGTGNSNVGNLGVSGLITATGNITANNAIINNDLFVGSGASTTSFTNPVAIFKDTGVTYVQVSVVNSAGTGSADLITYGNNGDDTQSWADIGFTGNGFNDANYTITGAGDGYFFTQGNASFGGNLVIATGNLGTTKDIIFGTGGFSTSNIKARLYNSNGAFSVTGNIIGSAGTFTNGLTVTGNITASGNLNYQNVTNLEIGDPLIYIGANNTGNLVDLGVVASYNDGTYKHTGVARNKTNGIWTFFDGVVAEPTTVIDWANATYPTVKVGALQATLTLTATGNANVGNIGTAGVVSATGNITGGNIISTNNHLFSVATAISAAGSTQGTATAISKDFNVVSTVTAGQGVVLPTAVAGMRVTVLNTSAAALLVYPATGATINALAANASFSQPAGARLDFISVTSSQWYTLNATYS